MTRLLLEVECLHGGTFNMFGGYIQENTSEEIGGGISVGISTWSGSIMYLI